MEIKKIRKRRIENKSYGLEKLDRGIVQSGGGFRDDLFFFDELCSKRYLMVLSFATLKGRSFAI